MNNTVLVVAETRDGKIQGITYELLGAARRLVADCEDSKKSKVLAVVMGYGLKDAPEKLTEYGADTVIVFDHRDLEHYLTLPYTACVCAAAQKFKPDSMLIGATSIGRDLAPRVSARLGTGLTADCTRLDMGEEGLLMTRPAFGGNLFAVITCPDHRPQMSTVRPGVMKKLVPDAARKSEIIRESYESVAPKASAAKGIKLIAEEKPELKADKIEEAKILVSVGRGARKNIDQAAELAALLGGSLSSSRAVVDAGLCSQDRQVGQTGKTVRPECYMALGISGAVQHLAGMEESDYIIAVNQDKAAPIFSVADLGVVSDLKQILPLLKDEILKLKAT